MKTCMFIFACLVVSTASCVVTNTDGPEADSEAESSVITQGAESILVVHPPTLSSTPTPTLACPPSISQTSGVADGYSTGNGIESPSPSLGLQAYVASHYVPSEIRKYDDSRSDRYFAHTFTGLRSTCKLVICKGTLTIRLKNQHHNDAILLGIVSSSGALQPGYWSRHLSDLGVDVGSDQTLVLNLAELPNTPNGPSNLLSQISSQDYLDVMVQDDSMVDYMKLDLSYCSGASSLSGGLALSHVAPPDGSTFEEHVTEDLDSHLHTVAETDLVGRPILQGSSGF